MTTNDKLREALARTTQFLKDGDTLGASLALSEVEKLIDAFAAGKPEPQAQAEPEEIQRLEAHCIAYREAIAKKDAALDACVEALKGWRAGTVHPAAAIIQAEEAMK